ncbi:retinal rod rhodopsin-sensitive cgmp 3-cyclic phosphodiesterase subunit delta [Plasmopara halstedii]|uniref:Retinal rod rhodopsin-sensitive cgmp 3-cyclic phosphodiesterase subunit delta n=1 Tax=Plasmopara halstedii TaxID=4781 RepID=A0A0P1B3K5_PLAHL|nr:retinal rod rhodopsin-sensitive cgmp 3-cyclic phosphodiesterase subunit delta [Plasmopara halstedii]CEG49337.1 retinal rod rhodopsin-sensitive cgmp 3-cyclic phosphodiesterase subunit delta [Plasmopara halstedii]|eukprot:XP_024585706.1 retinal rod rhodopsin-sensitive cgmp 3-cyclic phosphodiesterase subunit delta [Plasmopara halstedii]
MEPKRVEIGEEQECKISNVKLSGKTHLKGEEVKSSKDSESRAAQAKLDLDVEREWKQLHDAGIGKIEIANNSWAKTVCEGLIINHMNMRCAETGRLMWQSDEWGTDVYHVEQKAHLPKDILKCSAISREINFSSAEEISKFRLEQRVFLAGSCIEEWIFSFGYVIPGSTNTWQQTIESDEPENMLDPEAMNGKLTIETAFYDGQLPIAKTVYRIYYV